MNTSNQDSLNMTDILSLWPRHRSLIVAGTLLSLAFFTAAAFMLPQRFKSHFTLAIHSSYFQNPLTRDLTPDIYDSAEMRSQRESLIRQALTPEFIDMLGEKYGIYQAGTKGLLQQFMERLNLKPATDGTNQKIRSLSEEREQLMARITVLNLNNDTFQVSFLYTNPEIAFHVSQDIYAQVTRSLGEIRRRNLLSLHDAIQKRLNALAGSLPTPSEESHSGLSSTQVSIQEPQSFSAPRRVEDELAEVRSQLRVMSVRYTSEHPLVKELREREKALSAMHGSGVSGGFEEALSVRVPTDAAVEMYKDLTRKLNYLNISFESDQTGDVATLERPVYPANPLWPSKSLVVLWGLIAGLIGSFFLAALREYFDRSTLRVADFSQELGVPLFGVLPVIAWGAAFPNSPKTGLALHKVPNWN